MQCFANVGKYYRRKEDYLIYMVLLFVGCLMQSNGVFNLECVWSVTCQRTSGSRGGGKVVCETLEECTSLLLCGASRAGIYCFKLICYVQENLTTLWSHVVVSEGFWASVLDILNRFWKVQRTSPENLWQCRTTYLQHFKVKPRETSGRLHSSSF